MYFLPSLFFSGQLLLPFEIWTKSFPNLILIVLSSLKMVGLGLIGFDFAPNSCISMPWRVWHWCMSCCARRVQSNCVPKTRPKIPKNLPFRKMVQQPCVEHSCVAANSCKQTTQDKQYSVVIYSIEENRQVSNYLWSASILIAVVLPEIPRWDNCTELTLPHEVIVWDIEPQGWLLLRVRLQQRYGLLDISSACFLCLLAQPTQ